MFYLRRLTESEIQGRVVTASGSGPDSPRLLSLEEGHNPGDRGSFSHDWRKSFLGYGEAVFTAAKCAFAHWQMFDQGWVRVVNREAPLACGQIIAVEVRSLGVWSVNLSRILETVDSETQFGFLYSTTAHHVEQGEETFMLRFDPANGEVSYELEAVSRPRYWLARMGYPVTRYFQHRFARDSHRRMQQAVTLKA